MYKEVSPDFSGADSDPDSSGHEEISKVYRRWDILKAVLRKSTVTSGGQTNKCGDWRPLRWLLCLSG